MTASERLKALGPRIADLTERINDGFPLVSSGADDPMIDGVGALSELEALLDDVLPELIAVVEAAENDRAHHLGINDDCETCAALAALDAALTTKGER